MRRVWKVLLFAPLALAGLALFLALGGALVQALWNWLLPPLFGWPVVTFWQALGLLALCRILFGGVGGHRGGRGFAFRRHRGGRWAAMSPEDRDRVRQAMRQRCGMGPVVDAPDAR